MAAAEMYDYLTTISPDYNYTLTIKPHGEVSEVSNKNQKIHIGVDGSEERISFNTTSIFYISWKWNILSESDSGTIMDLYNDATKANGCQRSFKLTYGDGHAYVVRFDCDLSRVGQAVSRYGLPGIKVKILGRIAD